MLTGEAVYRETVLPGAVLTRVAQSHIRVGTFQFFARRSDAADIKKLADYVIARHYPGASSPLDLLEKVIAAQARLIARWMSLGFIHGVMNTDNMAISGETIDYGPCAFMDGYNPAKVFSSIDQHGRYAFHNQPNIAVWNLAQFASCLIPLMGEEGPAVEAATEALNHFPDHYEAEWLRLYRAKVGITNPDPGDAELIETLLARMSAQRADFTRTFRGLATGLAAAEFAEPEGFETWARDWRDRLRAEPNPDKVMRAASSPWIRKAVSTKSPPLSYLPKYGVILPVFPSSLLFLMSSMTGSRSFRKSLERCTFAKKTHWPEVLPFLIFSKALAVCF